LAFGVLSYAQTESVLPASYDMGDMSGMSGMSGMDMGAGGVSVPQLTGGTSGKPDDVFTLTARRKQIRLDSGKLVDAWTYNGQVPGPQLTVHQGDLVQVTLVNDIPGIGVTIHWHGVNVPNAEDGVPGVTQNAVRTGQSFTYKFRVHQVGTFWYHSHQNANVEVDKGLYGAFVILPKQEPVQPAGDFTVLAHDWSDLGGEATLNDADGIEHHTVAPGTPVRLRLINTTSESSGESGPTEFGVTGTSTRVAAIDGNDLNQPTDLPAGTLFPIGSGGRDDLTFTMPDHPVRLTDLVNPAAGLVLLPDGTGTVDAPSPTGPVFDPAHYGTPAPTPFNAESHFDRQYTITLDDAPGYYDGKFYFLPTIDGQTFPNTPMLMVREGDLVEVTLIDRGHTDHPMHLHGHTALVLSKDGKPVTGSPWWTDTLDIRPGETYQIAFRADNPGIWMDHCHNLAHAAMGMIMHLVYQGVSTPYRAGSATGNDPE
ncbi:MAG TPA: multicopper oxidase family protein, partial [Pseudonocardiaceae bacterium]|nr:multicopper oxidase family protein [Pseudonocardiaceae bacterium]